MNSRNKGKRGELELANFFTDQGVEARRGQQFKGGGDSPDVITYDPAMAPFHIECKRVEKGNLYDWLAQAQADADGKIPLVCHRRNKEEWVAILPLHFFIALAFLASGRST